MDLRFLFLFLFFSFGILNSQTPVRVVIPNAFEIDESMISLKGEYLFERDSVDHVEPLQFDLESHIGDKIVCSAIVPTIFDFERLFVKVDFDFPSDSETIHNISYWEIIPNETNTFYRWIFMGSPQPTFLFDYEPFEEEPILVLDESQKDSISKLVGPVFTKYFSNLVRLRENPEMPPFDCWKYSRLCLSSDFMGLGDNKLRRKLKTALIHLLEGINFGESMTEYRLELEFDIDDGEYYYIHLYLR
jgi:hypothetical protein